MKTQTLIQVEPRVRMSMTDLEVLCELGRGSYGKVMKVLYHKQDIYALKQISKSDIIKSGTQKQVKLEMEIMYSLNHDNIIKLISHIEDADNINLILEYVDGQNLYQMLTQEGKLQENYVIHYISQVVDAMIYLLHQPKPIIHRDIKPENILINSMNRVKLADFGSSNSLQEGELRFTFAGSALFMAPEIYANKGYNQKVDIWSLGVLIFELLTGVTPFLTPEQNMTLDANRKKSQIRANIENLAIHFPQNFPPLARDLLRRMLKTEPDQRLSLQEIQDHPFLTQNLQIRPMTHRVITCEERVNDALERFKAKRSSKPSQLSQSYSQIISLKQEISEKQVQIFKDEFEKNRLAEKLNELKAALQEDEEIAVGSNLVSPSKIVQIEEKFNKLNKDILTLQKAIMDNNAYINKNQDKLGKVEYLRSKLAKQKKTNEKLEMDLIELNKRKKQEQEKQDAIYKEFTGLNNNRSLDATESGVTSNQIQPLKEVVERVRQVIQTHKNYIENPYAEEQGILRTQDLEDYETMKDNQIDQRRCELQRDYDEEKRRLNQEIQRELEDVKRLEERNQKLMTQIKEFERVQDKIRRAEEVNKNLNFSYQIKQDRIKELQQTTNDNQKKITELTNKLAISKERKLP